MSLGQSSVSAGSYIATKEVIRGQMNDQMQAMQSPGGQSSQGDLTSFRRQMLDFAQSDGVNNVMTGAGFALAAGGGGDSLALSTGISEALINTAFGIATSWFAVISYNFFTNKIDKLTYALDEVGYTIAQTYEANHTDEA